MEKNIREKASTVLDFYYNVTKGDINELVSDSEMVQGLASAEKPYKDLNIESNGEYNIIRRYLQSAGFISIKGGGPHLTAKGIDEVEKEFPTLKPIAILPFSTVNELFDRMDEDKGEILEKIDDIKGMERYLEDIEENIGIIKNKLENILPKIEDETIRGIVRDLINSPNTAKALYNLYRLLSHPKVSKEIKEVLTSQNTMALPPHQI